MVLLFIVGCTPRAILVTLFPLAMLVTALETESSLPSRCDSRSGSAMCQKGELMEQPQARYALLGPVTCHSGAARPRRAQVIDRSNRQKRFAHPRP